MKIAMIGHKQIPSRAGGIEVVVGELSAQLVRRGHTVVAYNRKGGDVPKKLKSWRGVTIKTVFTLENPKVNAFLYSALASARCLFGGYDVVHYHAEGPAAMCFLPRLFGKKTVVTIHGLDWQRAKWGGFATKYLKFGEKMAAKHADAVIVLSESAQKYFQTTYGRETVLIPNGVQPPSCRQAEEITKKYGLHGQDYLLFLARIVPEKGLDTLLDAYEKLNTALPLVIAGGPSGAKEYYQQVCQRVAGNKKIIMTGFAQGQELEELYSNALCYVLPSTLEGMPISLLEAMSYGCCCVVSDISENVEAAGDAALPFAVGDADALAKVLNTVLTDKETVADCRAKALHRIRACYNWPSVTEKTEQVYVSMVEGKNASVGM